MGNLFGSISFAKVMLTMLSFIFMCWPLLMLGPLQGRKYRYILTDMIVVWSLLAVVRVIILFDANPIFPSSLIIREPLNTTLFLAAGAILLTIQFGRRLWQRQAIQRKANKVREIEDLFRLTPKEFEDIVVGLYVSLGHQAQRTGAVGDHGVDVVVKANNGEKWVVQCKRWRGAVGEPIVRDFYGVMHHEKADKGAIITTGTFTPQAREWAKGKPLTLLEGDELLTYLKRARTLAKGTTSVGRKQSTP